MLAGVFATFISLLILLSIWAITGFALIQPVTRQSHGLANHYLCCAFALMVGCLSSIFIIFLLGVFALLTPPLIVSCHLVLLLGATLCAGANIKRTLGRINRQIAIELVLVAACLLLVAILAWQPPGLWDDTSFHLPLVRFYLQQEAIVLQEYLRFPLFPQNINMLMLLGLAVGDTVTAQAFATLPWLIALIGLMGASRWLMGGNALPGILLAAPLLAFGPVAETLGFAYVDMGLAMFCWGGCLALAVAIHQPANSHTALCWAFLAGTLLGAATGSKLFGGVYTAIVGAAVLVFNRDVKFIASLVAGGLLIGCWWYIRSYWISGDPVHPAGGAYFGYFLWDHEDLISQTAEQKHHGVAPSLTNLWSALVIAKVQWWLLLVPSLFMTGVPRAVRLMQLSVVGYFIFWFFVSQVARYLAPIAVPALFLCGYTLYRTIIFLNEHTLKLPTMPWSRTIAPLMVLVIVLGGINETIKKRDFLWDTRLANKNGYTALQEANKHIPQYGSRLLQIGFENAAYFYDGLIIGDWFGLGRYRSMIQCDAQACNVISPDNLAQLLTQFDSNWVLIAKNTHFKVSVEDYKNLFNTVYEDHDAVLLARRQMPTSITNLQQPSNN